MTTHNKIQERQNDQIKHMVQKMKNNVKNRKSDISPFLVGPGVFGYCYKLMKRIEGRSARVSQDLQCLEMK